ncbi:MAG: DUF1015 domain-containing protein [Desulfobacterales bacterium]
MAEVIPFKGILYNTEKIGSLADVATPPYDVISEEEQINFHNRHPYNIIRLILGNETASDDEKNSRYTRAAAFFNKWITDEVLVQDNTPAFYLSSVEFSMGKKVIRRFGIVACVRLEPFEKGIILPHEKTFSKVKSERLQLMKACHANFSPVFSLFQGKIDMLSNLERSASSIDAHLNFIDDKGHKHLLWKITDPVIQQNISNAYKDKILYIADGHHRYETALNYKEWVSGNDSEFSETHPANFIMMYLCSMEAPGLIILPAHRLLTGVMESNLSGFEHKASKYFDITQIPFDPKAPDKATGNFFSALRSESMSNKIGVLIKNRNIFYILSLKQQVMETKYGSELPESLMRLDVTVLTKLILPEIVGFDQGGFDDEKLIAYTSSDTDAMEQTYSGKCDIAFILNPTKIEQVQRIAGEGLIMPRKSTYFYPKVMTGEVINKLSLAAT